LMHGSSSSPRQVAPGSELRVYALGSQLHGIRLCARFLRGPTALTSAGIRFVGCVGSSYMTGVMAGLTECSRRTVRHPIVDAENARLRALLRSAASSGECRTLLLGLHSVGCRAAVTDACFLSVHGYLAYEQQWAASSSFAAAATSGIFGKVLLDTIMTVQAGRQHSRSALGTLRDAAVAIAVGLRAPRTRDVGRCAVSAVRGFRGGYRGVTARVLEFVIGYICTQVVTDALSSMSEL